MNSYRDNDTNWFLSFARVQVFFFVFLFWFVEFLSYLSVQWAIDRKSERKTEEDMQQSTVSVCKPKAAAAFVVFTLPGELSRCPWAQAAF